MSRFHGLRTGIPMADAADIANLSFEQAQAEMEHQAQLQAARAEYEQCSTGLQCCKSRCSMQTAMGSLGTMNNSAASFQNGMSGLQCLASCEESYSCREP